jgi:hypothetical protein
MEHRQGDFGGLESWTLNEYWILLQPANDVLFVLAGQSLAAVNDATVSAIDDSMTARYDGYSP